MNKHLYLSHLLVFFFSYINDARSHEPEMTRLLSEQELWFSSPQQENLNVYATGGFSVTSLTTHFCLAMSSLRGTTSHTTIRHSMLLCTAQHLSLFSDFKSSRHIVLFKTNFLHDKMPFPLSHTRLPPAQATSKFVTCTAGLAGSIF